VHHLALRRAQHLALRRARHLALRRVRQRQPLAGAVAYLLQLPGAEACLLPLMPAVVPLTLSVPLLLLLLWLRQTRAGRHRQRHAATLHDAWQAALRLAAMPAQAGAAPAAAMAVRLPVRQRSGPWHCLSRPNPARPLARPAAALCTEAPAGPRRQEQSQ
jgi:hypothetical protein